MTKPYRVPLAKVIRLPRKETLKKYEEIISGLYEDAGRVDEAELIVAVLYFTGVMFYYDRDAVKELNETISEFMGLLQNREGLGIGDRTFFKLFSYVYIHITELEELYVLLFNLVNIPTGSHYDLQPFAIKEENALNAKEAIKLVGEEINSGNEEKIRIDKIQEVLNRYYKKEQPIWNKISAINKLAKENGKKELSGILSRIYDNKIRNAFSHNNYRFSNKGIHYGHNHLEFLSFEQLLELFASTLAFMAILADSAFSELGKIKDKGGIELNCKHGYMKVAPIIEPNGYRWHIESKRLTPYF